MSAQTLTTEKKLVSKRDRPPLYLPDVKHVRIVSLGFDNVVADVIWFQTLNYFGKQYIAGRDYKWLNHMCQLVTKLDPKTEHTYEFCGTLLSWMARDPEASNVILTQAIEHHPESWRYYYLRGFNYWYFMEDYTKARDDFENASRVPDAPPFLSSLASRLIAKTVSTATAYSFLTDMVNRTNNPTIREALEEKRKLARLSYDQELWEKAIAIYNVRTGLTPTDIETVATFLSTTEDNTGQHDGRHDGQRYTPPLTDPYGGTYILKDGKVTSTSNKKGLTFSGKTAKTGIFKSMHKK